MVLSKPLAVERLVISFEGAGAGSGPLSWGQIESWNAVRTLGHWMPLGGVAELRPGTTLQDVIDDLRFHLSRHVTLRTRLHIPPDGGTPTQEVHGSGELPLEVYETASLEAAAQTAELVAEQYRAAPLDFGTEWPVRAAVVSRDGVPSHLVALLSHFATDGIGAQIMLAEVVERPRPPVDGLTPLEQAAWQRSPAGQRQNVNALRHFESILTSMPALRFPAPAAPRSPRYWQAAFDSAVLPAALSAITARLGADPAATLLAVFAVALHETFGAAGAGPVVVRPLVSNRFRAGLGGVVCTAVQAGLCQIDATGDFDAVVDRARRASLGAFKYAYFDQRDLWTLMDRVGRARGETLDIGCFLNDRRGPVPPPAVPPASSTLEWVRRQDHPGFEPLILDVEDTERGLRGTLHMDTRWLDPGDAERLLWSIEAVAVRASGQPD